MSQTMLLSAGGREELLRQPAGLRSPFDPAGRRAFLAISQSQDSDLVRPSDTDDSLVAALASLDEASARWREQQANAPQRRRSISEGQEPSQPSSPAFDRGGDALASFRIHVSEHAPPLQPRQGQDLAAQGSSDGLPHGELLHYLHPPTSSRPRPAYLVAQPRQRDAYVPARERDKARPLAGGPTLSDMRRRVVVADSLQLAKGAERQREGTCDAGRTEEAAPARSEVPARIALPSFSGLPLSYYEQSEDAQCIINIPNASQATLYAAPEGRGEEPEIRQYLAPDEAGPHDALADETTASTARPAKETGASVPPRRGTRDKPKDGATSLSWSQRRDRRIARRRRSPPLTRRRANQHIQVASSSGTREPAVTVQVSSATPTSVDSPLTERRRSSTTHAREGPASDERNAPGQVSLFSASLTADVTDPSLGETSHAAALADGNIDTARKAVDPVEKRGKQLGARRRRTAKETAMLTRRLDLTLTDDDNGIKARPQQVTECEPDPSESLSATEDECEILAAGARSRRGAAIVELSSSQTQSEASLPLIAMTSRQDRGKAPQRPPRTSTPTPGKRKALSIAADDSETEEESQALLISTSTSSAAHGQRRDSALSRKPSAALRRARRRQDLF